MGSLKQTDHCLNRQQKCNTFLSSITANRQTLEGCWLHAFIQHCNRPYCRHNKCSCVFVVSSTYKHGNKKQNEATRSNTTAQNPNWGLINYTRQFNNVSIYYWRNCARTYSPQKSRSHNYECGNRNRSRKYRAEFIAL